MQDPLNRMIERIVMMKDTYEELLRLSLRKKEAIDRGDVTELDLVVGAEELLLLHAGDLEKERRGIAEEVSADSGIPIDELTLRTWPGMDEQRRGQIEVLQSSFLETLGEISRVNDINSRLLSIQLEYIQQVMDEVTHTRRETSYDPDGGKRAQASQQTNLLDRTL